MLALNTFKKILMVAALAVLAVGCAEENTSHHPQVNEQEMPGPYVPPGSSVGDAPDSSFEYGATTNFIIEGDSLSEKAVNLTRYAGEARYSPRNAQINVNLVKRGNGFGGRIQIGYIDEAYNGHIQMGNKFHKGVFVNGDDAYFNNESKTTSAKYNLWFNKDGKIVFHGFFQDMNGPLVMVIDDVESTGDGQAPSKASGSIWFKNFANGPLMAPLSPTHCWLVSLGPYDCRAWKSGKGVNTTSAVNPDQGYIKLGTFSGLDIKKAFNTDLTDIL